MSIDLCSITSAASISTSSPSSNTASGEETKCAVFQSPIVLSEAAATLAKREQKDKCDDKSYPLDRATNKVQKYVFNPLTKNFDVPNKGAPRLVNNEEEYRMVEFHFHEKAEHTIDSKQYAIELHLVFQSPKSSAIYVIGMIAQVGKRTSRIFKRIVVGEPFRVPTTSLNPHFSYPGSLTTPPFTKAVSWNVLSDIETITIADLEQLKSMSKGDRKIQPRDGRDIIFTCPTSSSPCCKLAE